MTAKDEATRCVRRMPAAAPLAGPRLRLLAGQALALASVAFLTISSWKREGSF